MKARVCTMAGTFYPKEPGHLEQLLGTFFRGREREGGRALGIVSPHAGYPYSGAISALAYSAIDPGFSGTFVVIGPSHRGYSTCLSMVPWETPIGIIDSDTGFAEATGIPADEGSAQAPENSLEVQMPFIKYRFPRSRIVPVLMGRQDPKEASGVADAIVSATRETGRDIRIVASSDFSHYIPASVARKQDLSAIEPLISLDIAGFYQKIGELRVSACGYGPVAAMVLVCSALGAKKAELLRYATSGDVTGDQAEVVGYAAVAVI